MSKPTGDSLHPRDHGFWSRGSLPALSGALIAAVFVLLALLAPGSGAQAQPAPKFIPPTTEYRTGSGEIRGLVRTRESSPTGRWIVAARPGERTEARASEYGATAISRPLGIYALPEDSATGFILSLRSIGAYRFSEPDVKTLSGPSREEGSPANREARDWWLNQISRPNNPPKKINRKSPTLALLEQSLDRRHPDLAGLEARDRLLDPFSFGDLTDARGTAMTALAASLTGDRDGKVTGVWPGMKVRLARRGETCESKTAAVYRAARSRLNQVLAMGYAFAGDTCFSHYLATEYAVYRGLVPIAEAGNQDGSISGSAPPRPASDPHVLTITASNRERAVPAWARSGDWIDLTAPGDGLEVPWISPGNTGQPLRNWRYASGTEYSTAIAAAAAAWVMQARPNLKARQVIRLLTNAATPLPMTQPSRNPTSGHGLLNLARALRDPAPVNDPLEPNDDISWVRAESLVLDGEAGKPVKRGPFWQSGNRTRKVTATLGRAKDPADVYRIRIGPKAKVRIKVSQFSGDTKLMVVSSDATSIGKLESGQLIASDDRVPGKTAEAIDLSSNSDKWQTAFVAIKVSDRQVGENSTYRLAVEPRP